MQVTKPNATSKNTSVILTTPVYLLALSIGSLSVFESDPILHTFFPPVFSHSQYFDPSLHWSPSVNYLYSTISPPIPESQLQFIFLQLSHSSPIFLLRIQFSSVIFQTLLSAVQNACCLSLQNVSFNKQISLSQKQSSSVWMSQEATIL